MSRQRGFTLAELMTVVVIVTIAGALALISIGRTNRSGYIDGFAADIRAAMTEAGRRAMVTRRVYLVTITANSVQWCQVSPLAEGQVTWNSLPTACPAAPLPGLEQGGITYARGYNPLAGAPKVQAVQWTSAVDRGQGGVTWSAMPAAIYFLPDGRIDSDLSTVPPALEGVTVRLQSSTEQSMKRKIYLYPFGGRPRVQDSW